MILSIINKGAAVIVAMIIASAAVEKATIIERAMRNRWLRAMFDAVIRRSAGKIVRHAQASTALVATPPQAVKEIRK
jgi:hypothetical protein